MKSRKSNYLEVPSGNFFSPEIVGGVKLFKNVIHIYNLSGVTIEYYTHDEEETSTLNAVVAKAFFKVLQVIFLSETLYDQPDWQEIRNTALKQSSSS